MSIIRKPTLATMNTYIAANLGTNYLVGAIKPILVQNGDRSQVEFVASYTSYDNNETYPAIIVFAGYDIDAQAEEIGTVENDETYEATIQETYPIQVPQGDTWKTLYVTTVRFSAAA